MGRLAPLLLLFACASASDPGELAPGEPPASAAGVAPTVPWARELAELAAPPGDDPCAAQRDRQLAALCEATQYDEDCVGFSCARTASRSALECMLEQGEDTETFVELSRAGNPVTRVYAREALLRRDAMTPARIVEGLTDPAVVPRGSGCIIDAISAAEPAFVALLQQGDDALLRAFLDSTIGRAMLVGEHAFTRAPVLRATLYLASEPRRSAELRASVRALGQEAAASLPAQWTATVRAEHVAPTPPANALAAWTRELGCDSERGRLRQRQRANEAAERARLLEIERELAEDELTRRARGR